MSFEFRLIAACAAFVVAGAVGCLAQEPPNLLRNGGFERVNGGRADAWQHYDQGYVPDSGVRHSGAMSLRCVNTMPNERRGASYTLDLHQKSPAPLLVSGWSRAENVSGSANSDYAVYVDVELADGTPLWGQTASFGVGTHDWQRRQVLIASTKPIRVVHIYALFRNHTGTVWFDDFAATELSGTRMFDSQPLAAPRLPPGVERAWYVRDVAANSALQLVYAETRTATARPTTADRRLQQNAATLQLRLSSITTRAAGQIVSATLEDRSGRDRAATLYYIERFDARRPVWWNDIRSAAPAGTRGEWTNLTRIDAGAVGAMSLYPFGCVTGAGRGRAMGVAANLGPRVVRIGYHAAAKLLYAAFDIALVGNNRANSDGKGHGRAMVSVARYNVDPVWGFRSAAACYYALFPDAFQRRARAEGIWMPFTDPSTVKDVQDFGVAYHEGDNSLASDDRLGILSFRYTEPMTWWMPMPPDMPRTYDDALRLVTKHGAGTDPELRHWAEAVVSSGSRDEGGRYNVEFRNEPWANGAVWVLNPNPLLPHPADVWTKARLCYTTEQADKTYRASRANAGHTGLDGEYLDSIEGWADVLDFRGESLRYAKTPPTYSTDSHRPAVPTWFSVYELAAFMRDDLHRRGKLLMANSTPWRFHAFAPVLDVMGTETDWLPGGTWRPDSDALFNLRRTLCFRKPYLLLQNTDFEKFGHEQVEKYFQRSMFYGVFPSMFSANAATHPYWEEPRWYNRDRDLFKRYIPVIKRLSAAGWQPITRARSDRPSLYVERYGGQYWTVFNNSSSAVQGILTIEIVPGLYLPRHGMIQARDMVTGERMALVPAGATIRVPVSLKAEEGRALELMPAIGRGVAAPSPYEGEGRGGVSVSRRYRRLSVAMVSGSGE